jgi:hypothetical protein
MTFMKESPVDFTFYGFVEGHETLTTLRLCTVVERTQRNMTRRAMADDPEVTAMQKLNDSLTPLDEAARERVIEWAIKRYGGAIASAAASERVSQRVSAMRAEPAATATNATTSEFGDFADLYDAAGPKTDHMKALVGGYWLQVCGGATSFASAKANELLKNHGHPVSNITRAFDLLRESKPSFAAQLEKSGKSQQARKKMKLTTAGVRKVQAMIAGTDEA